MSPDWSFVPYLNPNDAPFYDKKIEQTKRELYANLYDSDNISISQRDESIVEFVIKKVSLSADMGINTINTIFTAISEGIGQMREKRMIGVWSGSIAKCIFILEGLTITFTYNASTKDFYKGLAAVVFDMIVASISFVVISILGVLVSLSLLEAVFIAAIIAFIAGVFANTKEGKDTIEWLAEIIKTNIEKARKFLGSADSYWAPQVQDEEFWRNICQDIACKDFSADSLHRLLAHSGYYKADGNTWAAFLRESHHAEDIVNDDGTFTEEYKAKRNEAFYKTINFRQNNHKYAYYENKPKDRIF